MKHIDLKVLFFIAVSGANAQAIAPLWQNFINARQTGATPTLPDFSYAGYHFSEKPVPDISTRKRFNVTDYGARPDDAQYDDAGIQSAILAAENNADGGVVFFPPGK